MLKFVRKLFFESGLYVRSAAILKHQYLTSYLLLLFEMKSNCLICACMCERHPGERGLMSSSSSSSKYIILHTKNVHSPSLHLTLHPPPSPPPRQTPSFGLIYHTYLILTPTLGGRSSSLSSSQQITVKPTVGRSRKQFRPAEEEKVKANFKRLS